MNLPENHGRVPMPDAMLIAADKSCATESRWVVTGPAPYAGAAPPRSVWPVHAHNAFGRKDIHRWLGRFAGSYGYPLRVEHFDGERRCLFDTTIWGPEDDEDDGMMHLPPSPAAAALALYEPGYVPEPSTSPMERAVKLVLEQPETVANAVAAIVKAVQAVRGPGDGIDVQAAIDQAAEKSAQRAAEVAAAGVAEAVRVELGRLMAEAGFESERNGELAEGYPDEDQAADRPGVTLPPPVTVPTDEAAAPDPVEPETHDEPEHAPAHATQGA